MIVDARTSHKARTEPPGSGHWAVLDLFFNHASNGATFTDVDRQHLYRIKYQQTDPDTLDEEVTAA